MNIEVEREEAGRWIAGIPSLPGAMIYGQNRAAAISKVKALALRVLADLLTADVMRFHKQSKEVLL